MFGTRSIDAHIDRKTQEAIEHIESHAKRIMSELSGVDKYTLTRIREILASNMGETKPSFMASALKPLQADIEAIKNQMASKGYVTPEEYGAVGDGTTDDTNALQEAFESGFPVLLTGIYRITSTLTAPSCLIGCNSAIWVDSNMDTVLETPSTFYMEGVNIYGMGHDIKHGIRSLNNDSFIISNAHLEEIYSSTQAHAIHVQGGDVKIDNVTITDIFAMANGSIGDGPGSAYGIVAKQYKRCNILHVLADTIHSVGDSGNITFEDSSAIYMQSFDKEAKAVVTDCISRNVGKYGFKSQAHSVKYERCHVFNEYNDFKDGFVCLPANGDYTPVVTISNCGVVDTRDTAPTEKGYAIENHVNLYVDNMSFDNVAIGGISNNANSSLCNVQRCAFVKHGIIGGSNVYVSDSVFNCGQIYANYINTSVAHFHNCILESHENTVNLTTYQAFEVSGKVSFNMCSFDLWRYGSMNVYEGGNTEFNECTFTFNTPTHSYLRLINGSKSAFRNCFFDTTGASSYVMETNGSALIVNCAVEGDKRLVRVTGGNLETDICPSLIVWESPETITHRGMMVNTLPTLPSYAPDNVYALLLTEGKIYKTQTRKWVAVN